MPRFVILRHDVPAGSPRGSHFDLMFEVGGSLLTWAADSLPVPGGPAVRATPLDPHRIAYLDYEGPVSNDRGSVCRVASGTCQAVAQSPDIAPTGGCWPPRQRTEFAIDSPTIRGRIIFQDGWVWLAAPPDKSDRDSP